MSFTIDPLESRLLLSSTLAKGVLTITGTSGHDQISINYVKIPYLGLNELAVNEIRLGSSTPILKKYNPAAVKSIVINTGAGNDGVIPMASPGVNFAYPITFNAGPGNDTLSAPGATGKITVYAGDGDDVITTGPANDFIDGGKGNDRITTNAGHDTLTGGAGLDLLQAGDGNDTLYANDRARDTVNGGNGSDRARLDWTHKTPNEASLSSIESFLK